MRFAMNKENERVDIYDAIKIEDTQYYCPICHKEIVIKNGTINVPHFAHKSLDECDTFSYDMTEWHRNWQNKFPKENQEIVIKLDINEMDYFHASTNWEFDNFRSWEESSDVFENLVLTDEKDWKKLHIEHRADVCINGYVIEFQHSPISHKEFNERNWFYTEAGYKLIWIFDFAEEYEDSQMECYDEWNRKEDNGGKYRWSNPKRFMKNFVPQNMDDIKVIFEICDKDENKLDEDDSIMERVVWAIEDEDGYSNFKRFITSYYPGNFIELKEQIDKRTI